MLNTSSCIAFSSPLFTTEWPNFPKCIASFLYNISIPSFLPGIEMPNISSIQHTIGIPSDFRLSIPSGSSVAMPQRYVSRSHVGQVLPVQLQILCLTALMLCNTVLSCSIVIVFFSMHHALAWYPEFVSWARFPFIVKREDLVERYLRVKKNINSRYSLWIQGIKPKHNGDWSSCIWNESQCVKIIPRAWRNS